MASSINDLTPQQYKVLENRVRRMAARQGMSLTKSRRRDGAAVDYGVYWLTDSNSICVTPGPTGWYLDEIERFLLDS
jgi:hypothetical protein